jgi:hypothetical protein
MHAVHAFWRLAGWQLALTMAQGNDRRGLGKTRHWRSGETAELKVGVNHLPFVSYRSNHNLSSHVVLSCCAVYCVFETRHGSIIQVVPSHSFVSCFCVMPYQPQIAQSKLSGLFLSSSAFYGPTETGTKQQHVTQLIFYVSWSIFHCCRLSHNIGPLTPHLVKI